MSTEIVKSFRKVPIAKCRNIGIAAHIDSGKTTLTERILFFTGRIHKTKEVHEGEATMDFMKSEKERGITITSAAITCLHNDHRINIIDTPGHVDFTIEVERSMRVLDAVVIVFDGVAGVEPQSETVWSQANKYDLPRICFVNKMDRQGANFTKCVNAIRSRLTPNGVVLSLPVGIERDFHGVIDILERRYIKWNSEDNGITYEYLPIPDDMVEEVENVRKETVERIASLNDALTIKFFENIEITLDELKAVLRENVIKSKIIPIVCGSALKNVGVQFVLDLINDYFPSPLECKENFGTLYNKKTKEKTRIPVPLDQNGKLAALIFKTQARKNLGSVTYIRIYSGTLKKGTVVYNVNQGREERISRIVLIDANNFYDVDEGYAGEVLAILFRERISRTGDTICDSDYPVELDNISVPVPVISMAIEANNPKITAELTDALRNLSFDDPSLHYSSKKGQLLISGMGELHLMIVKERLEEEYSIHTHLGQPQVSYKITIKQEIEEGYIHKRQTGGSGEFAEMILKIEPKERQHGVTFVNKIVSGRIPSEYIPSIEKGIREAAMEGINGCPIVDFECTLLDGSYHSVDSNSTIFQKTAHYFFLQLIRKIGPVYLEPIMKTQITFPEDYYGAVSGDCGKRRGIIYHNESDESTRSITIWAHIPLSEMFGYVNTLRSITQGYGQYSMEYAYENEIPDSLVNQLVFNDKTK